MLERTFFQRLLKKCLFIVCTNYCAVCVGYRLQGDPIITCQNNGDWSERRFMCEILSCSIPPLIRNGIRLNDDVTFGSRVTYRCNKGTIVLSTFFKNCFQKISCNSLTHVRLSAYLNESSF